MYRILIADDEVIEKKVLYKTLNKNFKEHCEIYQAENGREALELFEEKDIQIAILDIEMPGINGIEAAEEMRKRKPECCIIFLTAYDYFSYAKKAITIRALDYLLKPYQENELINVVEEAIRLCRKQLNASENAAAFSEDYIEEMVFSADENSSIKSAKVVESVEKYLMENYANDISLQDIAAFMNYSDAYFCKLFKQCFNKNFMTYLTEYRIEEAKKLLENTEVNVKNIGETVGYSDSNYFAKVFKRTTGLTPTEYRCSVFQQK